MGDSSHNYDLYLAQQMSAELNDEDLAGDALKGERKICTEDSTKQESSNDVQDTSTSIVDTNLEVTYPTPDIHKLFEVFNERFFWHKLGSVKVKWSPKMLVSAGICEFNELTGQCTIFLSAPLLLLRPRNDLVDILLHEMIHAYLYVTKNNQDRDAHGPEFIKHMKRINELTGSNIMIYHDFHDEVALYEAERWGNACCKRLRPFFDYIKRSVNRSPSPKNLWWKRHQETCDGDFIGVKEPESYKSNNNQQKEGTSSATTGSSPGKYNEVELPGTSKGRSNDLNQAGTSANVPFAPSTGTIDPVISKPRKHITNSGSKRKLKRDQIDDNPCKIQAREPIEEKKKIENNATSSARIGECSSTDSVERAFCPVCETSVHLPAINDHLDRCLASTNLQESNLTCLMCQVKLQSSDMSICTKCCNASLESHPIHCPVCDKEMKQTDLNGHLELCISDYFVDGNGFDVSNSS